jgi:hypothetical protein
MLLPSLPPGKEQSYAMSRLSGRALELMVAASAGCRTAVVQTVFMHLTEDLPLIISATCYIAKLNKFSENN